MRLKIILNSVIGNRQKLVRLILLCSGLILMILSLSITMLNVERLITSSRMTYVPQWYYQYQVTFQYQCNYIYTMNGLQLVCGTVQVGSYVMVMTYVPQWIYYTTSFANDVHLYDMILSSFALGSKQLFFVIPILLLSVIGSLGILFDKKLLSNIGYISVAFVTIVLAGAVGGILRLLIVNPENSSLSVGFFFALLCFGVYISLITLKIIELMKEGKKAGFYLSKSGLNLSYILRVVIFGLFLLVSETFITTIYSFLIMIFAITFLVLSLQKNKVFKILQLISASSVFVYSMTMMIIILIQGLSETSFFDLMPWDSILLRVINIGIVSLSFVLFRIETKNDTKTANQFVRD